MIRGLYLLGSAQCAASLPEAAATLRRALTLIEASRRPDDQLHLWILNDLALVEADQNDDHRSAAALLRKALSIRERIYAEDHPDRICGRMNLGEQLMYAGELDEARQYLGPALPSMERAVGPEHTWTAVTALYLGELERRTGHLDRARSLLERTIRIYEAQILRAGSLSKVANGRSYGEALRWLGLVDESERRWTEAVDHLGRAREVHLQGIWGVDPTADYARVLRKAGRIADAERIEASLRKDATTR